jgi:hypothetical protein
MTHEIYFRRRIGYLIKNLEKRLQRELNNPRLISRGTPFEIYKDRVIEAASETFLVYDFDVENVEEFTDDVWDDAKVFLYRVMNKLYLDQIILRYKKWLKES